MKALHSIVAVGFGVIALAIYVQSDGEKRIPTLISALISNVSLLALSVESSLERNRMGGHGSI